MKMSAMTCAIWVLACLPAVPASCSLVRQPGGACVEGHDHHDGAARAGGPVLGSRRAARRGKRRQSLQGSSRVLPRGGNPQAHQRFRYQGGSLAACQRLERQVPGRRQRRLGRSDQLFRHGRGRPRRICERVHRHRACGRPRDVCARSSRKADRLRVALRTRNDREGQGRHPGVLRQRAQTVLLERLLDRRETGPQGSAEVSG